MLGFIIRFYREAKFLLQNIVEIVLMINSRAMFLVKIQISQMDIQARNLHLKYGFSVRFPWMHIVILIINKHGCYLKLCLITISVNKTKIFFLAIYIIPWYLFCKLDVNTPDLTPQ